MDAILTPAVINVHSLAQSYSQDSDLILSEQDRFELIMMIYREYTKMIRTGIQIILCDDDPYPDYYAMADDLRMHHRLKVFTGGTSSPLLSRAHNIMFRAVHDWHHVMCGGDFTIRGELAAFHYVYWLTNNPNIRKLLFSEIVLQAGTYYSTGQFPEQRIVDSSLFAQYSPGV